MKKSIIKLATVALVAMAFISCASKSKSAEEAPKNLYGGQTYNVPCLEYDDDEWFVGNGMANGSRARMDVLQGTALVIAQSMIRQKMKHLYVGVVADYRKSLGGNQGSDAGVSVEIGGDQIIDRIVNETRVVCGPKFTEPDAKGNVNAYIGIKISKKEVSSKFADGIETNVPESERQRIEENKREFREHLDKKIKEYRGQ